MCHIEHIRWDTHISTWLTQIRANCKDGKQCDDSNQNNHSAMNTTKTTLQATAMMRHLCDLWPKMANEFRKTRMKFTQLASNYDYHYHNHLGPNWLLGEFFKWDKKVEQTGAKHFLINHCNNGNKSNLLLQKSNWPQKPLLEDWY